MSWTLGTITRPMTRETVAARRHIGDQSVTQVATQDTYQDKPIWRSATPLEAITFAPLPKEQMPV